MIPKNNLLCQLAQVARLTRLPRPSTLILPIYNLGFGSSFRHISHTRVCLLTPPPNTSPNFDTQKFALDLEQQGFTPEQARTAVKVIKDAINDGITLYGSNLTSKESLSKMSYQQKVDFAKLKGELQLSDKSEFNSLSNEHERLRNDLEKVRTKFKEEINKSLSSVRLDLSLEKGRIREENSIYDLKIKETDTRIDEEIANMKAQINQVKTQVMQWLFGVCTGTFAVVLAYVRLIS